MLFLKTLIRQLGPGLLFLTLGLIGISYGQNTNSPNIIFILTDDQRWDAMGIAGNPIIQTPQMDDLGRKGTYFKNAFATTPICAASRASILTGIHERTHGYTFQQPNLKRDFVEKSYPALLKSSGYHVGFYGKLGVNIDSPHQYFDASDFYDRSEKKDREGYYYKRINNDTVHLTRYTGHKAQEFIQNAPANKPFCLSLSFSAPHAHDNSTDQYYWQEKSAHLYKDVAIPPPLLGEDSFFTRLPNEVKKGYSRTRWKWRFDTPEKYQQMVKGYYRMITEIDDEIGAIRKLLVEKGIANNTIIIVMGDNGYFLGDRQLADKWLMYDMSIRIPLIIYDPRRSNTSYIDAMVLNIDIPKTILKLAGLTVPQLYQGIDLSSFLENGNVRSARNNILIEHLWKLPEIPASEGIRTNKWKYFRYKYINAPEELYNLKNDPLETKNLSGLSKYKKKLSRLRKRCDELIAEKSLSL